MDIFLFNIEWMVFNLYLALLPVLFAWFLFKMPNKFYTIIVGFLWFLYLPNTIYIFTDLHHLVEQWSLVNMYGKVLLLYQYAFLEIVGLWCFLVAFYPMERILKNYGLPKNKRIVMLVGLNFLMGFAMVLGKFERVNSWDAFLNPLFVVTSVWQLFTSHGMLLLAVLFGLFANFFYFLFRDRAKKIYAQWFTS